MIDNKTTQSNTGLKRKILFLRNYGFSRKNQSADVIRQMEIEIGLRNRGYETIEISNRLSETVFNKYAKNKIFVLLIYNIYLLINLRRNLKLGIDIIQTSDLFSTPILFFLRLRRHQLIVYDLLGFTSNEIKTQGISSLKRLLSYTVCKLIEEVFLYNSVDLFLTINETHKNILMKKTRKPIFVIRDGIDEKAFNDIKQDDIRMDILIKKEPDDVILVFAGYIGNRRLDKLFSVIPDAINNSPNLKILIIGSGPDLSLYIEKAKSLGQFNKKILLLGQIPHKFIPLYINISDIGYSDIWSEIGFPTKIYEYIYMGKAVITEDTISSNEILINQFNSVLVKNEKELLDNLIILSKNKEMRDRLAANARDIRLPTWNQNIVELDQIFKSIMSEEAF